MNIAKAVEKKKFKLNAPKSLVNKINFLIEVIHDKDAIAILNQVRGVLIDYHINLIELMELLRSLKSRLSSLREEKIPKSRRAVFAMTGLIMALSGFIAALTPSLIKQTKAIKSGVPIHKVIKKAELPGNIKGFKQEGINTIVIDVDEKVWEELEKDINSVISKIGKDPLLYPKAKKLAAKYGIKSFFDVPAIAGEFNPKDKTVNLNLNTVINKGFQIVKPIIRHEMTHKAQDVAGTRYKGNLEYVNRPSEIGAFHNEIKPLLGKDTKVLYRHLSKISGHMLTNIVLLYPESDPVVKVIKQYLKAGGPMTKATLDRINAIEKNNWEKISQIKNQVEKAMKEGFKEKAVFYLNEANKGYQAMATRLSNDTGKKITVAQVKKYLKKIDKRKVMSDIKKRAKKASDEDSYKYGTIYKILVGHFSKS